MDSHKVANSPPTKRRKVNANPPSETATPEYPESAQRGLHRPISPPLSRRRSPDRLVATPTWSFDDVPKQTLTPTSSLSTKQAETKATTRDGNNDTRFVASPVHLTRIQGLAAHQNVDAVGLGDLLGDPLIRECWNFNFLFDLDFVMQHFDSDVRDMIKVKIVHGFWKRDDANRIALLETAEQYPNIELLSAYIPDPFGTHHSKMLILFRHDDTAQIIIHTANMIRRDWANMTQAVWASPQLPLLSQIPSSQQDTATHPIGSGKRFKVDLLKYLSAYERRSKDLIKQLNDYDFSSIRAAFIGSAPSRQKPAAATPSKTTSFGWLGLQEILSNVPILRPEGDSSPHIVTQISSIATLGAAPTWLSHFQSILERHSTSKASIPANPPVSFTKASAFFTKPEPSVNQKSPPAKHSIIFPTPEEIRTSLDGYASGGSIHWKLASAQQQKQLVYMHPMLCHWNPPSAPTHTPNAHRGPAAPHIKTYMRFSNQDHKTIDWAMVTSANFSKQAWGDVVNKKEEIWIQSWETGVVVWPALFAEANEEHVAMVPVFGQDLPRCADDVVVGRGEGEKEEEEYARRNILVGFRMPYNVPLVPYAAEEKPWCATMQYREPDRFGRVWNGY